MAEWVSFKPGKFLEDDEDSSRLTFSSLVLLAVLRCSCLPNHLRYHLGSSYRMGCKESYAIFREKEIGRQRKFRRSICRLGNR